MKNLYDMEFFKKSCRPDRLQSYKVIAEYLYKTFRPKSVIDFGCGCGWVLMFLRNFGVSRVLGLEFSKVALELQPDFDIRDSILCKDLRKLRLPTERFDLALCIEVAEHIEETYIDTFVFNITRSSDVLVFSAAPPGQGGVGHVNEKPWSYWVEKFLVVKFFEDAQGTNSIQKYFRNNNVKSWYSNNTHVLRRKV